METYSSNGLGVGIVNLNLNVKGEESFFRVKTLIKKNTQKTKLDKML